MNVSCTLRARKKVDNNVLNEELGTHWYQRRCVPLITVSIDALADPVLHEELIDAAEAGGTKLRILPNHACATAAQHGSYNNLPIAETRPLLQRPRFGGW